MQNTTVIYQTWPRWSSRTWILALIVLAQCLSVFSLPWFGNKKTPQSPLIAQEVAEHAEFIHIPIKMNQVYFGGESFFYYRPTDVDEFDPKDLQWYAEASFAGMRSLFNNKARFKLENVVESPWNEESDPLEATMLTGSLGWRKLKYSLPNFKEYDPSSSNLKYSFVAYKTHKMFGLSYRPAKKVLQSPRIVVFTPGNYLGATSEEDRFPIDNLLYTTSHHRYDTKRMLFQGLIVEKPQRQQSTLHAVVKEAPTSRTTSTLTLSGTTMGEIQKSVEKAANVQNVTISPLTAVPIAGQNGNATMGMLVAVE